MMDRSTYITIALLALIALATQALVWVFVPRESENSFVGPPRSDYTLGNFTLDALDEQGHHSFTMVAPRLVRKEDDGSIFVTAPNYEIVDNGGNLWKGKSETAWVNHDGSIMKLEGDVDMHRIETEKVTPVQLLTRDLTVTSDPKTKDPQQQRERRMETAEPATIIDPQTVAHGIGMKTDMTLKTIEFLSAFHSTTQPGKLR
ncbi:MAG TPA: LPS export ABC transporter periplasmic protein LptC [Rudaea sp.]|jgi:lipopolysaccharide export system protein LptC|nr:LPS export ABC transporter periplasmic protein LptC [Rudaea sp.]